MPEGKGGGFVDFNVAKQVAFVDALRELELLVGLRRDGDELKGICPLHGGESGKESFGVNTVKGYFKCFGCKKAGNVLDFTREYRKCALKEAAQWLVDLKERLEREARTPAAVASDELTVREQAICRAVARYLAAVFAPLGNVEVIDKELGKLIAEEVGKRN
jgi:DNA primase